jgi:hypothetical protein
VSALDSSARSSPLTGECTWNLFEEVEEYSPLPNAPVERAEIPTDFKIGCMWFLQVREDRFARVLCPTKLYDRIRGTGYRYVEDRTYVELGRFQTRKSFS